jgi:superfamily II DNA/RNA helicase
VLVATPGRLVDLIERGACRLDKVEITVLDEADYMADLGFLPVVTKLLEQTPAAAQRLLFSATLDRGVATLVQRFLTQPAVHAVPTPPEESAVMTHRVFTVGRDDKVDVATRVAARPARTLFFVRTKHGADRLAKQLGRGGVEAAAIHGNLGQGARQRALAAFTEGRTRVLVATDVAARGIHVDDVDLVVHFDPPNDHKDYLHRSGRTARAGADGTVVALVQPEQLREVQRLHAAANVEATVEAVHPNHPAVLDLGRSGEPIVVRPSASTAAGSAAPGRGGAPGRSQRAPGRRQSAGWRGSQGRPQQRERRSSR